jgi:hypothetical protein
MVTSYKEGNLAAKRAKEGIIEQREKIRGKKKKVHRPWIVYGKFMFSYWGGKDCIYAFGSYETEEQAISLANKKRREFKGHEDRYWVVNEEGFREWYKAVLVESKGANSIADEAR